MNNKDKKYNIENKMMQVSNLCAWKKYIFRFFCFIVLFQIGVTAKAQTKADTLDRVKLYVDSVKLKKVDMVGGLDAHYWTKKRYSESASHEVSYGNRNSNEYSAIIRETIAFLKKQRIDRIYIYIDNKLCYYSENRQKYKKIKEDPMPCLEVYFYDGKILGYNVSKRSKKLNEESIEKIIKKGGYITGTEQIVQW